MIFFNGVISKNLCPKFKNKINIQANISRATSILTLHISYLFKT